MQEYNNDFKKRFFGKIRPLYSIEELLRINTEFPPENHTAIMGVAAVLFAHPKDILASQSLIPKLTYLHYRSDVHLDFFIAGMVPSHDKDKYLASELAKIVSIDEVDWYFSEAAFISVIQYFEVNSSWIYKGGADLLVLDYKIIDNKINWNFGKSFQLNLEKALELKAVSSVHSFLESLILFAKERGTSFSAHSAAMDGFKNQGEKSLVNLFSKFIPLHITEELSKINVFIPLDLNKRQK